MQGAGARCLGLRLGPVVGSWRDLHPHFQLHLTSYYIITGV